MRVNILKNIQKNLHIIINKKFNKISILIFSILFFTIIYMLLDDSDFAGINKFKEAVKEEVIKKKAQKEIQENFDNYDYGDNNTIFKEQVIDQAAKQTEEEVEKTDLKPDKVQPNLANKFLNRLYFATSTGCLLGYGDIYPVTDLCKIITGIQGILTIALIIY